MSTSTFTFGSFPRPFRGCPQPLPLSKSAFTRRIHKIKPRYDTTDYSNVLLSFRSFDKNYFGIPCNLVHRSPSHSDFVNRPLFVLGQTDEEFANFENRRVYTAFLDAMLRIRSATPDPTNLVPVLRRSPTKLAFERISNMEGKPLPIVSRLPDSDQDGRSYQFEEDGATYYHLNRIDYYTYYHQDEWTHFKEPRVLPKNPVVAGVYTKPLSDVFNAEELTPPLAPNPQLFRMPLYDAPEDDDSIFDLIPGFTWAKNLMATVKATGNSILSTVCGYILRPIAQFALGAASAKFMEFFTKNVKNIMLSMTVLLVVFVSGYASSGSIMASLISAIGAMFLAQAASNIGSLISLCTDLLVYLTNPSKEPGLETNGPTEMATTSFDLLRRFFTFCGVNLIYFTEAIHQSWMRVRSLQDFGAFILEMMPLVIQDLIYQYAPSQAVMMMYRNSGYQSFLSQMEAIVVQMKMNYTQELGEQFIDIHKKAENFLQTRMSAGWYRTAKAHCDEQKLIYTRLNQQMNNHNGIRPFMVQIGGQHNLGKSRIIKMLADQANSIDAGYQKIGCYFTRPTGQYWEGYSKERTMVYPEVIGRSEETNTLDVEEWCGLYEGCYKPNFAFAPKGSAVEMIAVYGATNNLFPYTVCQQNNLDSYWRKRDLCIEAVPNPAVAHIYGTAAWKSYLSAMSAEDKRKFDAFRYRFLCPTDPKAQCVVPGLEKTSDFAGISYQQTFTATELMRYHARVLRTFMIENEIEFGVTQGLLEDSFLELGIAAAPIAKAVPKSEDVDLSNVVTYFFKHIAPYLALASTITAILLLNRKNRKAHEIEEMESVPASRLRGKANKKLAEKISASHGSDATGPNQIAPQIKKIQDQICSLRINDKHILYGFVANDNTLLCNAHFFRVADQFVTTRFTMVFANGLTFAQLFEPHMATHRTFRMGDQHLICDSVIVKLTMNIPTMKDLTKIFINDYVTPSKVYRVGPHEYWYVDAAGRASEPVCYDSTGPLEKHLVTDRPLRYNYNSSRGDCGMLILSEFQGRLICHGIHTGSTGKLSYVNSVLAKQFIHNPTRYEAIEAAHGITTIDTSAVCNIPVGQFSSVGYNSKYVKTPMETQLMRTVFPDVSDLTISPKSSRILMTREARFGRINVWPVVSTIHSYAVRVTVEEYLRGLSYWKGSTATMTPEDAVASLDPTTSVGYGWSKKRAILTPPGPMTGWDPAFLEQFTVLHNKFKQGIYPWAILVSCLKDESMSTEKAAIQKTRTFHISPYQWNILGKMYFGAFMEYMSKSHRYIPSTIGLDPNTSEFHDMFTRLLDHSPMIFDGDYSAFETLVVPPSVEAWLEMCDTFYGPVHSEQRKIYIYCMLTAVMVAGNSAWVKYNSNPSGQITTCHLNSTVNTYYQACAYKAITPTAMIQDFHADVRHAVCGDDIIAASKLLAYNFNSVQAYLKTLGIVFSVGNKKLEVNSPDFTPHELATYLKAHFYRSETFKGFVAYVDDAQLHRQLVHCRDASLQGQLNLALSVLHTAQMHGDIRCLNAPPTDMLYPQWLDYIERFIPSIKTYAPSMATVVSDYHRYAPNPLPPVEVVEVFDDQSDFEIIEVMEGDVADPQLYEDLLVRELHKHLIWHREVCDDCGEEPDSRDRATLKWNTDSGPLVYILEYPCGEADFYHGLSPLNPNANWVSCDGVHYYNQNLETVAEMQGNVQTSVTNNTINGNGNSAASGAQHATTENQISSALGNGKAGTGGSPSGGRGIVEDVMASASSLGGTLSLGTNGVSGSISGSLPFGKKDTRFPRPNIGRGPNATPLPPHQRTNITMEPMPSGAIAGGTTDQPNHTFAPLQVDQPTLVKTTLNGVDQANVLGDVAALADCASFENFSTNVDEMTIGFYTNHFSHIGVIPLTYTQTAQTHLLDIGMHPFQSIPTTIPSVSGTTDDFSLTRLEQWCSNFMYWHGDLHFRLHLAGPRELALRIAIVLAYDDLGVAPAYQQAVTGPTIIHDFDESHRDIVVKVPYVSPHEWMVPFYKDQNAGILGTTTEYSSMGTLRIYLSTRVAGNANIYTNGPELHIYMSGANFETKRYIGVSGLAPEGHFTRTAEKIKTLQGDQGSTSVSSARVMMAPGTRQPGRLVPINLKEFAKKWVTAAVMTVSASSQPSVNFRHPDDTLLGQANFAQSAMRFYRGDLNVRVTPVASGWVGGHYIMYWAPYCAVGYYDNDITNITNLDYIIIDLASNQAVEFVIPYRFHKEFFRAGQQDMYGHLNICPLGNFQGATTGTSAVDLEIQFSWSNFQSYVPAEIALTMSSHEAIGEIHSAGDEEQEVVTAALTASEANATVAQSVIDVVPYGHDHRIITHMSDLLKRMVLVDSFVQDQRASNPSPFYTFHEQELWNNGPTTVNTMNYASWVGDRIVQFITSIETKVTTPASGVETVENNVKIFLLPGVDTTSSPLIPDLNSMASLMAYPNNTGSPIPNHGTTTSIFNRNTYGMVPLLETRSLKNRVVIPYHCVNKFVVYAQNPNDLDGPKLVDQFSQGLLVFSYTAYGSSDGLPNKITEVYFQFGDGFRMSHYRPRRYSLSGMQNPSGTAYANYFGQYFAFTP